MHPTAVIHPHQAPPDSVAAMRVTARPGGAHRARGRASALPAMVTYDDLLTRLRDTLAGPNGEQAVARLRARYRVVLIDEFQDTDPVQWEIVHRAFGTGGVALVLIADPKQAIYAFRGADVHAYLERRREAGRARDAAGQLAQRPGADRRARRAVRRRQARSSRDRVPDRSGQRLPTRARGCAAPPARRRCGSGSWIATVLDRADRRRLRVGAVGARRTSRRISPPTSSRCCRAAR